MAGVVICCEYICDSFGGRALAECGPFSFNLKPNYRASKPAQRVRARFRHLPIKSHPTAAGLRARRFDQAPET